MNRNLRLIIRVLRGCRKEIWRVGQETPRGPGHHRQAWCCPGTGWTCAGKLLRPQALREMGRRGGDVGLSKHWRTGLLKHAEGLRSQPVASTCHLGVAVGWLIFFFSLLILVSSFCTPFWIKEQHGVICWTLVGTLKYSAVCYFSC